MRPIVCCLALAAAMLANIGCTPSSPSDADPAGSPSTIQPANPATLPTGDTTESQPSTDTETPDTEKPESETPETETPDTETPDTETPESETPDTVTPEGETPGGETPEGASTESKDPGAETETVATSTTPAGDEAEKADDKTPADKKPKSEKPDEKKPTQPDSRRQGKLFKGGKTGDVIEISFEDVNLGMPVGAAFRPFMLTDRAKLLNGKRVRIKGFVMASDRTKGMKEFVLLRNTECKFGPGGQADHLLRVFMRKNETASYRSKPVSIEGILRLNVYPSPRQTWSVFDLEDASGIVDLTR